MFRYLLILMLLILVSCKESEKIKTKKIAISKKIVKKEDKKIVKEEEILIDLRDEKEIELIDIKNSNELLDRLEENNLFVIDGKKIPQFYLKSFPKDLKKTDVKMKKKIFFHSLIPMAIFVSDNIKKERNFLLNIINKYPNLKRVEGASLDDLSEDERETILSLAKKYRSKNILELKKRIDILPISLLLSQSAMESAWGGSRFARLGNNLFGIWAKKDGSEKSIPAKYKKRGIKRVRIKAYNSLLESVEDYCYKINTVKSYNYLRKLRTKTKNSIRLAKGLRNYSERKMAYVKDIQKLIKRNRLYKYDNIEFE